MASQVLSMKKGAKYILEKNAPFHPGMHVQGHASEVAPVTSFELDCILQELEALRIQFETQKMELETAQETIKTLRNREILDVHQPQSDVTLQEINQRFAVAADSAGLGVWEYNLKDNSLIWDDEMYRVFNVEPDEFEGVYEAWAACVHPEDLENAAAELQATIRQEKEFNTFFRIIWKSGEVRFIKADARVVNDAQGVPYKIIGINYDITSLKNAELALSKSLDLVTEQNKRLLNFSYIVSHNLRSHTSNIKAISNFLYQDETDPDKQEMFGHLLNVSNRLDDTLHNLNEVVSIQTNINLLVEPLNLAQYLARAMEVLKPAFESKDALVLQEIDPDIVVLYNPAYLESVLLNVLSNSIKYSHPDRQPRIELRTSYSDKQLMLHVQDNGIGIDLEKHGEKIFGMYKTFHNNSDARGIGLFITKNQIEAMGGSILVQSVPNEGTCFTIVFA
jgi:PAS domain S-box-containing protein